MGFRGFKGSPGEKGSKNTGQDFKICADGWIQIGKKCFAVFNDTELMVCSFFSLNFISSNWMIQKENGYIINLFEFYTYIKISNRIGLVIKIIKKRFWF